MYETNKNVWVLIKLSLDSLWSKSINLKFNNLELQI